MVSAKLVRQAIYQKLNVVGVTNLLGGGSASLYHQLASIDARYPLVIFHKQSGQAVDSFGGQAFKSELWLVKGVAQNTSASAAEDIDKAVNDALDFQTLSISGATNLFMARESDVDYLETSEGQQYRHHGGLYRLIVA